MIEAQRSSNVPHAPGRTSNDAMSRLFAQRKVQEVLVATYTPPFIETLRVDVLQRPIELAVFLGRIAGRSLSVGPNVSDCRRSAIGDSGEPSLSGSAISGSPSDSHTDPFLIG
jgi:hypothetical protein